MKPFLFNVWTIKIEFHQKRKIKNYLFLLQTCNHRERRSPWLDLKFSLFKLLPKVFYIKQQLFLLCHHFSKNYFINYFHSSYQTLFATILLGKKMLIYSFTTSLKLMWVHSMCLFFANIRVKIFQRLF